MTEYSIYVIAVLRKYSSIKNPLCISEIQNYVQTDYDCNINHSTIQRLMNSLIDSLSCYDDYGYRIETLKYNKKYHKYEPYEDFAAKNTEDKAERCRGGAQHYYYYEAVFTKSELLTLIGCIETHPYFNSKEVQKIREGLESLQPGLFIKTRKTGTPRNPAVRFGSRTSLPTNNPALFDNISKIYDHIDSTDYNSRFICMDYCKYGFDMTLQKKTGKKQLVYPLALMWSNGYCYMLAKNIHHDNIISYRVDRIRTIDKVPDKDLLNIAVQQTNINVSEYQKQHPVMQNDPPTEINMFCQDTEAYPLANMLVDTFGSNFKAVPITQAHDLSIRKCFNMTYQALNSTGEKWYYVTVNASRRGTILWAKQQIEHVVIIGPDAVRKEITEFINTGAARYR